MKKAIFPIAAIAFFLNSCCHETVEINPPKNIEKLIFGSGKPECSGDCYQFYLLDKSQIFPDSCDFCPREGTPFLKTPLPSSKFEIARPLFDNIPAIMFEKSRQFGCPGCNDSEEFFLQIHFDSGDFRSFAWDGFYADCPPEIKDYLARVGSTINELN